MDDKEPRIPSFQIMGADDPETFDLVVGAHAEEHRRRQADQRKRRVNRWLDRLLDVAPPNDAQGDNR